MPVALGLTRRPSLLAAIQPVDRIATKLDRHTDRLDLLDMASFGWILSCNGADHAGHQPALPILDPH